MHEGVCCSAGRLELELETVLVKTCVKFIKCNMPYIVYKLCHFVYVELDIFCLVSHIIIVMHGAVS